jgi:hypothetical protein
LHEQHAVPRNSLFIDLLVWGEAADSSVWGPFRPFFAGHRVAVEFCSGHLTLAMLHRYFAKAQFVTHEGSGPGAPRLFVLCNQRPEARLRELAAFATPGPVAGSWHLDLGAAGQAIIAVAPELPAGPGTSVLRLTAPKTSQAEHSRRAEDILTDPTLSDKLKRIILREERMLNRDHTNAAVVQEAEREVDDFVEQYRRWKAEETARHHAELKAQGMAQGMAQGIKKGIKKGIAEGRAEGAAQGRAEGVDQTLNALLAAAAPFLPPERIEELRLQRDPVAIAFAIADARR